MLHAVSHLQPPPLGPQPGLPFTAPPSLEGLSLADGEPLDGHARLPARQAPDGRCAAAREDGAGHAGGFAVAV